MPVAGSYRLSRGEVMMYLDLAILNRESAAKMAGVSRCSFYRLLRIYRVKAPKSHAKLNAKKVREIRVFLGKRSRAEIAEIHDVHERTIDQIAMLETWYQVE